MGAVGIYGICLDEVCVSHYLHKTAGSIRIAPAIFRKGRISKISTYSKNLDLDPPLTRCQHDITLHIGNCHSPSYCW